MSSTEKSVGDGEATLRDAIAVWHLADLRGGLNAVGQVRVGVALEGAEREASLLRGGDGHAAEFAGGYLDAGEVDVRGHELTVCVRLCDPSGTWNAGILARHGGQDFLVFRLFAEDRGEGPALRFALGTQVSCGATEVSVPVALIGPTDWHDVVCRCDGAKLQLHVDGVWLDEEFPVGRLRQGNREPCLIGAESRTGEVTAGFRGLIDHVALFDRALSDAEIEALSGGAEEVAKRHREMLGAPEPRQYWRPHNRFFVGDTLPFYRDGVFRFYYLLDRGHHSAKGGYGAHQWAQASSTDLVHWEEQPLAIPITEAHEGSICTGSVCHHDGVYHGYYATRIMGRGEHLSLATSRDGVHFEKTLPNPFLSPGPQYTQDFRDPHVFRDERTGRFHLLVSTRYLDGGRGCLAQYVSRDLRTWEEAEPFLVMEGGEVPECPDHFEWNGWHYLLFSQGGEARYRMSRDPLGPWMRPRVDTLDGPLARVLKTAGFTGNRRIGTAFLALGPYAGYAIFRELIQHDDGTLGTKFPPEMIPATEAPIADWGGTVRMRAGDPPISFGGVPHNARITVRIGATDAAFGVRLRSSEREAQGHELRGDTAARRVSLTGAAGIEEVEGLERPFGLDLVLKNDILDVCLDQRRTLVNLVDHREGDRLALFCERGEVTFGNVEVRPLRR